ncbi:GGDEF domain-containing protein [Oceanotoga sp. DSM 15011]|jgi:diguanylate cyclase (GGDEF)-like protein|uniref:GGDEF domain-containing protein n=1 Tax=Oceanotoga sp. DSM 15011 TaxID=2984951 RepID=UPI0021F45BB8|nr:GGDEF domain-containing protein [Oceanotoga sp. DSM 15011]UYP01015.1 GGDEF domain-containing protein [Oceanotoga sp. DSM 15011]
MDKRKKVVYYILIITGILLTSYIPFEKFNIEFKYLIPLFLITYISDNLKIYWRYDRRLVSNIVGFTFSFILGLPYIFLNSFITFFRLKKSSLNGRLYVFLVYYNTYILSAIIAYKFDGILSIFLFLTLSKIFNSIIMNTLKTFDFNIFLLEYLHFLTLIPFSYFYLISDQYIIKMALITVNLLLSILYYLLIKLKNEKNDEIIKNQRLQKFNEITLKFSNILKQFSVKDTEYFVLDEIAKIIHSQLKYKHVLISMFDFKKNTVERITQKGLSENDFNKIKNKRVSIDKIMNLLDISNKYLETYFIPNNGNDKDYLFSLRNEVNINDSLKPSNLWRYDDLLLITLKNDMNDIIGYISCDEPESGLRPTKEELNILTVLTQLASITLENSYKYDEVINIAERDGLTKLYNHSKLFSDLNLFEKAGKNISIAFFDMDNFKSFNDNYGHLEGDKILKKISKLFKNNIRDNDRVYRYGGDEFVFIFNNIKKDKSKDIIKRFIEKTSSINSNITFSIGIADSSETSKYKELLDLADKRAYKSKKLGKDRITI